MYVSEIFWVWFYNRLVKILIQHAAAWLHANIRVCMTYLCFYYIPHTKTPIAIPVANESIFFSYVFGGGKPCLLWGKGVSVVTCNYENPQTTTREKECIHQSSHTKNHHNVAYNFDSTIFWITEKTQTIRNWRVRCKKGQCLTMYKFF